MYKKLNQEDYQKFVDEYLKTQEEIKEKVIANKLGEVAEQKSISKLTGPILEALQGGPIQQIETPEGIVKGIVQKSHNILDEQGSIITTYRPIVNTMNLLYSELLRQGVDNTRVINILEDISKENLSQGEVMRKFAIELYNQGADNDNIIKLLQNLLEKGVDVSDSAEVVKQHVEEDDADLLSLNADISQLLLEQDINEEDKALYIKKKEDIKKKIRTEEQNLDNLEKIQLVDYPSESNIEEIIEPEKEKKEAKIENIEGIKSYLKFPTTNQKYIPIKDVNKILQNVDTPRDYKKASVSNGDFVKKGNEYELVNPKIFKGPYALQVGVGQISYPDIKIDVEDDLSKGTSTLFIKKKEYNKPIVIKKFEVSFPLRNYLLRPKTKQNLNKLHTLYVRNELPLLGEIYDFMEYTKDRLTTTNLRRTIFNYIKFAKSNPPEVKILSGGDIGINKTYIVEPYERDSYYKIGKGSAPCRGSYKILPKNKNIGMFGDLEIDLDSLRNKMQLIASKDGVVLINEPIENDTYYLLTKNYLSTFNYSDKAIKIFRKLVDLGNVPLMPTSCKFDLLASDQKRGVQSRSYNMYRNRYKTKTGKREYKRKKGGELTHADIIKKEQEKQQEKQPEEQKNRFDNMIERLALLVGSVQAGNTSKDIKNEISDIADILFKNKLINASQHKNIFSNYIN